MLRIYSPEDRVPVAEVRETVLRVRAARRLTQGQLAKKLRVNRKMIERIEQSAVETVDKDFVKKLTDFDKQG